MSERVAVQGWRRDQTGQVIAVVAVAAAAAADNHSRFVVGAVDSHILIVALGNQYTALACGVVVGSLWKGYPPGGAVGRTRLDSWQMDMMPVPVGGTAVAVAAAAVAIAAAGRTAGCIR